ncbi:MAG: acylphosphatase [Patescibacteria group bacterium]
MTIRQAQVFISGFVQGVGFRQFIKKSALKIGVKGWVRNLEDGRVEVVLQGRMEDIEKIIQLCRQGPFLAEVKFVDVIWEENKKKFDAFAITF